MDAFGPAPVIFLGDSHVQYIKRAHELRLFGQRHVSGCEVGGATAVGMRNPNALTDSLGKFRRAAKDALHDALLVTHLGEGDCGYVIWYRAAKHGESVEVQMDASTAPTLPSWTSCWRPASTASS